jgi:hypothetical protein
MAIEKKESKLSESSRRLLQTAVLWIAHNDEPGSKDKLNEDVISGYISVLLIADILEIEPREVADMVIRQRRSSRKILDRTLGDL